MNTLHDLLRHLGRRVPRAKDPETFLPDDDAAARFFLRTVHADRCPRCRRRGPRVLTARTLRCRRCGRVPLTAGTPLYGTRISPRRWIAAVWHVFAARDPISSRCFSTRYRLRHATSWKLLHDVRRALPFPTPRTRGARALLLGRNAPGNRAEVVFSIDEGACVCALVDDGVPGGKGGPPELALFLGRFRAIVTAVYCGVTRRYLHLYLAEHAARVGRATWGG